MGDEMVRLAEELATLRIDLHNVQRNQILEVQLQDLTIDCQV